MNATGCVFGVSKLRLYAAVRLASSLTDSVITYAACYSVVAFANILIRMTNGSVPRPAMVEQRQHTCTAGLATAR